MKQTLLKILFHSGITGRLRSYKYQNKLVTILCLHRVSNQDSATFFPFKVKDFEVLLQYLNSHYQVVTIATLHRLHTTSRPAIILSFDDGFLDFYQNALPLLKKYGMPCNLNVVTRCLDNNFQIWTQRQNNLLDEIRRQKHNFCFDLDDTKMCIDDFSKKNILNKSLQLFSFLFTKDEDYVDEFLTAAENRMPFAIPVTPMMSWDDLISALQNYDIELGSHSVSHITLSNIKKREKLLEEIAGSKKIIEERTGRQTDIFALPNGNYNEEVTKCCAEAGYRYMLTVDEKLLPLSSHTPFIIPRLLIAYENYFENILKIENFQNAVKNVTNKIKP